MEYPSSPRERGAGFRVSPRSQTHGVPFIDGGTRSSILDDPLGNLSGLMGLDTYAGWCNSPSAADQLFTSYGFSSIPPMPYASFDAPQFLEQNSSDFPDNSSSFGTMGASFSFDDKVVFQQTDSTEAVKSGARPNSCSFQQNSITDTWRSSGSILSQPVVFSLAEKMLKALSIFKESSGGGILAQVWVPMKLGEQYVLSTYEQPYLLDHMLAGYREVSQSFTFSTEVKPGLFPGLPGRVFKSRVPEWTSNIAYYNNAEYLRAKHAVDHDVHGSIALPIFDTHDMSCCAVLELVTVKDKTNFDPEIESVCRALQAVNLRSAAPPRLRNQCLSRNQTAALAEIADVLGAVCHTHSLPLALTWIPCNYTGGNADDTVNVRVRDGNTNPAEKYILCIEGTACYVNDKEMQGFVHTCAEHYLEESQGVVGKALESNHPFFFPDVKTYDINEYPLAHHARKFGLNAAVAIRLRSTYTGNDDYILEFFLPVNMKGSSEQQLLLNNLSGTMQKLCKSLRTVSGAEIMGTEVSSVEVQIGAAANFHTIATPRRDSQTASSDSDLYLSDLIKLNVSDPRKDGMEADGSHEQAMGGSRKQMEKKRITSEKNVSLSVLQQYFSGSLKDAAKSIGVCPTTLKRICRQHGISRWPSRKINKVNRSLRKIQTVLDSVQGVEGGLKFDPATGEFVAAGSILQESVNPDLVPSAPDNNTFSVVKMEDNEDFTDLRTLQAPKTSDEELKLDAMPWSRSENPSLLKLENSDSVMTDSSNGSGSLIHGSSSSSQSFEDRNQSKPTTNSNETDSVITVKATHKEDTVRFKFDPSSGCFQLYEEVAKRFKLQNGTFQLKYLDDEEEWVMLVSDSDLQECLEILEMVGKHSVKFLVREVTCAMGSSSSSNCFLVGGS